MKNIIPAILLLLAFSCSEPAEVATSTEPIKYNVELKDLDHHEISISLSITDAPAGPLKITMPQSSPGRYAVHNFAKNVYEVTAIDADDNPLEIHKTDIIEWEVPQHSGEVTVTYTLFANHGDGTYSGIDNRKLHINMPATFMFFDGFENRPIELNFDLVSHPNWDVATQLDRQEDGSFRAPNYYYFYDSPTMVGSIKWRRWNVGSQTIEIAAMIEDSDEQLDRYTEWVKKVVDEQAEIYGGLPEFDFGRYTFLVSYNPWIYGDGMEHRNSTVCSAKGNLTQHAKWLIGTISHEFFHAWNVERIRPKSLEPFDFTKANMSELLWFSEGFTSYYDDLVLTRAGIKPKGEFVEGLAGTLNYVVNSPARKFKGPAQMSMHAPFVDAATSIDENNYANTFVSYYSYGSVIGLVLDLTIRKNHPGKTLDDLMRYMWENYGVNEVPFTIADFEKALAAVTGDAGFAEEFVEKSILRGALPDMKPLFEHVGVTLDYAYPGKGGPYSLTLEDQEGGVVVTSAVKRNDPIYITGLDQGDVLLMLDGTQVVSSKDFEIDWTIGTTYRVTYMKNGVEQTGEFTMTQDPTLTTSPKNKMSEEQQAAFVSWLE